MPTLYQLEGLVVVRVLPLPSGVFTMGRGAGNDHVLDDAEVSRNHCRLTTSAGRTTVEDLQSRNGTWLAEKFLSAPTPLANGERMRIGRSVFVFREDICQRTIVIRPPTAAPSSSRSTEQRGRLEEFRFKLRWQFDWSGFAFGWRIRRV